MKINVEDPISTPIDAFTVVLTVVYLYRVFSLLALVYVHWKAINFAPV